MAERSLGRKPSASVVPSKNGLAHGLPPSSLAAQLVETISTSSKSSRSDENNELKCLLSSIQRIKDDPNLLKSHADRVAHNHTLIYVYCRVALEGLKLNDLFADRAHIRAEVLKALNFFRFTIKETPMVFLSTGEDNGLSRKGVEPLWIWLLPQLLRILGHANALGLEGTVEGFLQYILLTVCRTGALLGLSRPLGMYLRACVTGILDHLQSFSMSFDDTSRYITLELPPSSVLADILDHETFANMERKGVSRFYLVDTVRQALQQAASLSRVLAYPSISHDPCFSNVAAFWENGPWVLDVWLDLRHLERRWGFTSKSSPLPLMELAIDSARSFMGYGSMSSSLCNKANTLLVLLCNEVITSPSELVRGDVEGEHVRLLCCRIVYFLAITSSQSYATNRLSASKLVQEFMLLSTRYGVLDERTDIWKCFKLLQQSILVASDDAPSVLSLMPSIQSEEIRASLVELGCDSEASKKHFRNAKRQKTSDSSLDTLTELMHAIVSSLEMEWSASTDPFTMSRWLPAAIESAPEQLQCLSTDLLSRVGCLLDGVDAERDSSPLQEKLCCALCDQKNTFPPLVSHVAKREARKVLSRLVQSPPLAGTRRFRVMAMIALQRMLIHCEDPQFLDLRNSDLGKWCLQSLNSSVRELRLAAISTLVSFVSKHPTLNLGEGLGDRNRVYAIAVLKESSEHEQASLVETRIMTWARLGRVVEEEELNLVLIKLLDYLGSHNSMVSSLAFNELLNLAEALCTTPRRLLEPYWKSLAYMTTKDMVHHPQRSRSIAELLQVSINELLLIIQRYALPYLVLDKRKDVIQKIADARREDESWQPLMDGANLAATMALLLVHNTDDMEAFAKSRLNEISPHFHSLTLLDIFQVEPVLIATELLKLGANSDDEKKKGAHKALRLLSTTLLSAKKALKSRKSNVIGRFLQSHVLGIMTRLTDVINDSTSAQPPTLEQRNCIRTLEEMISICQGYARIARPQISACLLSALDHDALRAESLSCWIAMLTYFDVEDVASLLETTFFIVGRYWGRFSKATAKDAKDALLFLLEKHSQVVQTHVNKLPSISHIPDLTDVESRISRLRHEVTVDEALFVFAERLNHTKSGVVYQAVVELVQFLRKHMKALNSLPIIQRSGSAVTALLRALLDCSCKYNGIHMDIGRLCMESIGLIGCLDSNQVEAIRERRSFVLLHNFDDQEETIDFVLFLIQEVLVPSFLSATDTKLQGFLSYAIQELLERTDIRATCALEDTGVLAGKHVYRKWLALADNTREVIIPFLTSRYMVAPMGHTMTEYPIFRPGRSYGNWLRSFVIDLLRKGQNIRAEIIFEPLTRVIRVKDLATAEFLLPYVLLHSLRGPRNTETERQAIIGELLKVLQHCPTQEVYHEENEEMKRFCHAVFRVLDYAMRWIQAIRTEMKVSEETDKDIERVENIFDSIPAELIAQRATDCNEYARALFHLEQLAQKTEKSKTQFSEHDALLERLQALYASVDEPDGLEGISAHLHTLNINQQILSHKKAGRWTAAQTWYEMQLAKDPDSADMQTELLACLKNAGQHDVLLNHVEGLSSSTYSDSKTMPIAVEAAWVTGRWESLSRFAARFPGSVFQNFNISVATLFACLRDNPAEDSFPQTLRSLREKVASEVTVSATGSLQAAHELLLKCHALTDLEMTVKAASDNFQERRDTMELLNSRLQVVGAYFNDKQYLLGIRRAAMELSRPSFTDLDISQLWLRSARLARKASSMQQSFSAVLHASQLGDDAATIENAKLLWRDNHHRKAIQMLQGAIERDKLAMPSTNATDSIGSTKSHSQQKLVRAQAQLLLAKWLDAAGQSHAVALRERYQQPPKTHSSWEKGHYYLGRHYKKILESEQPLKVEEQSDNFITGEIARLVIENYVRALHAGTKYLHQTLPRIMTLWLDLGAQVDKLPEGKASLSRELYRRRVEQLNLLHAFLDKYIHRLPAYMFYTALPQMVARIAHPNANVFERLMRIIVKVVEAHPRQALWSLIGIMTSRQVSERKTRGAQILQQLMTVSRKVDNSSLDLRQMIRAAEKLSEQLLLACHNGEFRGNKTVQAKLAKDLRFNHKCTPCPLVVPVESSLTMTLPAVSEQARKHQAFSRDVVSIDCFLDDVLVLNSLARPRRLTTRGSDGKNYMLLIKPKDDLRTDQRLMEFNGIINRSLKRDAESSRRQLYVRTYAVVPLNEECGIIEWVPGIKTMRDILLKLYASQNIHPDYPALKNLMEEASLSDSKTNIFTDEVLSRFPPVLPTWFIQCFPSPSAWFAARLRYARSCAVMSMVGTILGLGDRHGENVNLEEGNGGIFHVDFNCLFDKGLTFLKPERVPFRLTHNMVAAMGIYGYEGPFRRSSELTLSILRQQEETLMTVLEAFIYDPTLDLQKDKRSSKRGDATIKLQPQSVVDSIKRKVRGLLPNESIPLSVEGQVEELIKQAVDARNLTAMYIGWCPFL